MPSTIRFLHRYLRPTGARTTEGEEHYGAGSRRLRATVIRPAGRRRPLPGWVVLHGLTRSGRSHPSLLRFVRAVAEAGNVVLVPEIPEWRDLRVAPDVTVPTIREAVRALQAHDDVQHEHVGLFGFSFGATQAMVAATEPETAGLLSGIAAWGGYCDLRRLFRFGLTGLHELDGVTWHTAPDPYGCWIVAANYLPLIDGRAGSAAAAVALHELAIEAGEKRVHAWDPIYDASKRRLSTSLAPEAREMFELIAPESRLAGRSRPGVFELADDIATAALRVHPQLDPRPYLENVRVPVLLAHGRDDRLIPFTESIRLSRALPADRVDSLTITGLFQHSGGAQGGLGTLGQIREGARFVMLQRRVLRLV
jgi:dienelactone hydrolase